MAVTQNLGWSQMELKQSLLSIQLFKSLYLLGRLFIRQSIYLISLR